MLQPLAFRRFNLATFCAGLLYPGLICIGLFCSTTQALPPSEELLPDSTLLYVSIPDAVTASEAWEATPLGRLLSDPIMEAFREDLIAQLKQKGVAVQERLGMSIEDFQGLASGEIAIAVCKMSDDKAAGVAIIDVSKNMDNARGMLGRVQTTLLGRGSKRTTQASKTAGIELTVYDLPMKPNRKVMQAHYFLHQGLLVASDNLALIEIVAANLAAGGVKEKNLGSMETFKITMQRTEHPAEEKIATHIRWYARPIDALEAIQNAMGQKFSSRDIVKLARDEGFDALQAAGGRVSLSAAPFGVIHRTSLYAPPPYKNSMRMADFPNADSFEPEAWVPDTIDNYTTFQWDMIKAFDNFDTLFDAVVGEGEKGVWKDVIDSLKTDPNGPQIDIREQLVAYVGQRGSIMCETVHPINAHSQRRIFSVNTTNEAALAIAVEKMMKNDKSVQVRTLTVADKEYKIFLIVPEEQHQVPKLDINLDGKESKDKPAVAGTPGKEELPAHSAVAVVHGHLLIATHIELMEKVLKTPVAAKPLGSAADYLKTMAAAKKLHPGPRSLQGFTRDDQRYEVQYELFRLGHLPEADLIATQVLNALLQNQQEEGQIRRQSLDGSKLPPYAQVRKYFGRGSVFSESIADGWNIIGFGFDEAPTEPPPAGVPTTATTDPTPKK